STGAGFVDLAGVNANRSCSVVFRNAAGDRLGFVGNADTGGTLYITADVPSIALNRRPTFAGSLAWDEGNLAIPIGWGGAIPSARDLNTYTSPGYYHQSANSGASAGSNYPTANAGLLEVRNNGTS